MNKEEFIKFKEELKSGDIFGLEYLEKYIPKELEYLYIKVLEHNEIFGNGWTINDLLKMGKKDSYWTDRARNFIEKYNVAKEDYNNYAKYFNDYLYIRDFLFKELGFNVEELYN